MKYFNIFLLFLSISSGFACFFVGILLFLRYKLKEIRYYLYYFLTISFILIIITTNFYYKSIFLQTSNIFYDYIFFSALLIGNSLYIYSFSRFIHSILLKKFIKSFFIIFSLLPLALYLILSTINIFTKLNFNALKISVYFAVILIGINIFYNFCYILYNLKSIENKLRKKILFIILIFILMYTPFAIIDSFYDFFIFIFKYLPDGFSFSLPYYLIYNITSLFFAANYLLKEIQLVDLNEISKNTIKKFKITSREKEIAFYIMLGFSNQEISNKTFISMTTVKKHIYNLFQKTGAKNRVDLINILKENNRSLIKN